MALSDRIKARLSAVGISEAELARRVGLRQSSINALVRGDTRSSRHLHSIARELRTSTAFLMEETDDPDEGAPVIEAPSVQLVTMQVALPSEAALARMFEGLLRPLDRSMPVAELAQLLARRLPTGFAQLRDLAPEHAPAATRVRDEAVPARATDHHESLPASRT